MPHIHLKNGRFPFSLLSVITKERDPPVQEEIYPETERGSCVMKTIHIRLDGPGGNAMPKAVLESVYASDLEFEPDERRSRILPDGTVELSITKSPYMVHARMNLPFYGNIWVTADNEGQG